MPPKSSSKRGSAPDGAKPLSSWAIVKVPAGIKLPATAGHYHTDNYMVWGAKALFTANPSLTRVVLGLQRRSRKKVNPNGIHYHWVEKKRLATPKKFTRGGEHESLFEYDHQSLAENEVEAKAKQYGQRMTDFPDDRRKTA